MVKKVDNTNGKKRIGSGGNGTNNAGDGMCLMEKVLGVFLESPAQKYHVRGIARKLGISPRTAKKYLAALCSDGYLKMEKDGIYEKYRAYQDSQIFKDRKVFHTIRKLRESEIIGYIEEEMNYPAIILYGSAARGEDTVESDIDLFIISKVKKEIDVSGFEKKLDMEIQLMNMDETEFKKGKNGELQNNMLNGIVLSGFVEVF